MSHEVSTPRRSSRVPLALLVLFALAPVSLGVVGCAYDLTEDASTSAPGGGVDNGGAVVGSSCIPRQAVFCDCSDGDQGVQTCSEAGEWDLCDCSAPVGAPGGGGGGPGVDPGTWEVTCVTDRYWDNWEEEDDGEREPEGESTMVPGGDCIGCHERWDEGPRLAVGGTVFFGLHDDDDCYGAEAVTVEITGADDRVHRFRTNRTGNFMAEAEDVRIAVPYTARVITSDGVREMVAEQTNLDCNACHTVAGAEGAPGRIIVPDSIVQ